MNNDKLQTHLQHLRRVLEALTDAEREEIFSALHGYFCLDCGRKLEEGDRCHCENDE